MSCLGTGFRAASILSWIWRSRLCLAAISLILGFVASHQAFAGGTLPKRAIGVAVESPTGVDPLQFPAAIILLAGGMFLISWLNKALEAGLQPRIAAGMRDHVIELLRVSEAQLSELTLVSPVGVMLIDADGECLYSNDRCRRMTGRRFGNLAGTGWQAVVHPDDRDRVLAAWRLATASGVPFSLEFRFRRKGGDEVWVLAQAETDCGNENVERNFVCTVTDISDRKRAEQALERSEQKLRNAQRLAFIGNWERDLSNDEIEWSDQVYVIFGLAPQSEPINLSRFVEMVHPDDREAVVEAISRAVSNGETYQKTHRIVRPSGEVRTVQQLGEVTTGANGRPERFFGTVQDVTELRRAEDASRRNEAWFRTGFDVGGAGMVVSDSRGRYLRANPAFCAFIGYNEDELRNMHARDLTHSDDRNRHDAIWRDLIEDRLKVTTREKRYVTKSGETVWAITAAAVFRDATDGETYVISNIQDITERKAAEQALAAREQMLRDAQNLANLGSWERDFDSSVIRWSDQLYEIFGLEKGAYDGTFETLLSMVHPEDRKILVDRKDSSAGTDSPSGENFRIVRPDGEVRYARIRRRIETDDKGRPTRAVGTLQDVTELRAARIALEASEARFRGVFEAGGAGIVVADAAGKFIQINRAFADFLGYDEANLAKLAIFDVLRFADHDELRRIRNTLFAGMVERASTEFRFTHFDGGMRWATVSATSMTNTSEGGFLMILTVQDITQRKLADESLAHKSLLLDLVNELTVAANKATDFKEVVAMSLDRVCRVAGWAVGHAFRRIEGGANFESMRTWYLEDPVRFGPYRDITEHHPSADSHGMPRAVLENDGIEWRDRIPAKKGPVGPRATVAVEVGLQSGFAVPVRVGDEVVAVLEFLSVAPIPHDDGLADAVMQIGTELGRVYERQRAETALRRREEQFSQIIENAPLWIFVKDQEGRYLLVNKSIANAYGVTPEEMIGRTQSDFYDHPDHVADIRARDLAVIEKRVVHDQYVNQFHAPNGEVHTLRFVKVPFVTQDGDTALLGMAADITDEKRAEEELRRGQRLDALGHMTGGVAHDFNNLLTIILGNLQLLLRRLDDPAAKSLAETAERAARRGADVTGRLLAFARSQPLQPRPTDLNGLVNDMMSLVERSLGPSIKIERNLATGLWTTMADPAQVENALINLAVNARDALPRGGRIELCTANVSLTQNSRIARQADVVPGDYVRVALRDFGLGMTEETAARALEPFFTTKEVGKGSGLGLSSVYGFARQSGGGVRIQTAPGKGTEVSIYLPRCEPAPLEAADGRDDEEAVGSQETVLLVEDEPDVRQFAAQALQLANYRVLPVADADAALTVLTAGDEPVDVLFTDIVLPGAMDGWALAEAARQHCPKLRIILTSGNWELAGRSRPETVSDAAILQKPYSRNELAQVFRFAIDTGGTKRKQK